MRRAAAVLITFLALALAACQQQAKPDAALMSANRTLFDQIRTGQTAPIVAQMGPEGATPEMAQLLARLRASLPAAAPTSATPVGGGVVSTPAGKAEQLIVEYDFADRTARFESDFQQAKGAKDWKLHSFRVQTATHKQLAVNTLSLDGRPPAQLAYFALAITSPLLMLAAFIKVLRTPGLANRWLWCAFALVGLFSFEMNWASGSVLIQWMSLKIIGFWLAHGPSKFEPWFVSATVPIGALLILAGLVARKPKA